MAIRAAVAAVRPIRKGNIAIVERLGRAMLRARLLEEKLGSLYRAGRIVGGVYLGRGQEALSGAGGVALRKGDVFAPLIRDMAGRLAFGEPMEDALRAYLGSRLGPMKGRDGNIHRGDLSRGILPMISHLGAMVSTLAGVLMAKRMKGEKRKVGLTCAGDGATSTGSFHEGLNLAAVERLPLVVVVADNGYAYSTPNERQFACADLVDRARGYGVQGHRWMEQTHGCVPKCCRGRSTALAVARGRNWSWANCCDYVGTGSTTMVCMWIRRSSGRSGEGIVCK